MLIHKATSKDELLCRRTELYALCSDIFSSCYHWRIYAVFGEKWLNNSFLRLHLEFALPLRGNPGSATGNGKIRHKSWLFALDIMRHSHTSPLSFILRIIQWYFSALFSWQRGLVEKCLLPKTKKIYSCQNETHSLHSSEFSNCHISLLNFYRH